ncbi:MAG: MFS transporter [Clostridia bacterium]
MKTMNLKRQIRRLLALEWVSAFRPASAVWVLLLVHRGFSLAEIGLAEGIFHLVSLFGEVPSGVFSDLTGRKRALAMGQILLGLSAMTMLLSKSMAGICVGMAFSALGCNMASGTREAITYDSLLQAGEEAGYLTLSSKQNVIYRLAQAAATLCAGLTVAVGWRVGYGADVGLAAAGAALALALTEPVINCAKAQDAGSRTVLSRLQTHRRETGKFLKDHPRMVVVMLLNAAVGTCATLLAFYLQHGLSKAGAPDLLMGPLLLLVGLGGAVGSKLAPRLTALRYGASGALCCGGVAVGFLLVASGLFPLMALGGFLAVACDDAFQLLTDARLNQGIPSEQRATLLSYSSLSFSLVMVISSPLAGLAVSA